MSTSNLLLLPVTALLLPIAHAAGGGAGGESHAFWENFLTPPPLHPLLVNFTAALIPASFVSDLLGRLLRRESLIAAGFWTLLYAAVITPLTAVAGWLWLNDVGDMGHAEMLVHKWLGTALAVLLLPMLFWRWRIKKRRAAPSAVYLVVSAVLVLSLTVQGHLGGMMSFGTGDSGSDAPEHAHAETDTADGAGDDGWKSHIEMKE